jgi:release factor glutamine methyltransferase
MLDLGTGSGCLAITLSLEHPGAEVIALDVSSEALEVAADNNQRLAAGVHFMQGDLLKTSEILARLGDQPGRFDAIVANPPYIAEHDPHLTQGDLRYEPKSALTDGHDGLRLIDACIRLAKLALVPRGLILIEHGYDQASEVRDRLLQAGFTAPRSWADLAGIERVSGATR